MPVSKFGQRRAVAARPGKAPTTGGKPAGKAKAKSKPSRTQINGTAASNVQRPRRKGGNASGGASQLALNLRHAYNPTNIMIPPSLYSHHGVFTLNGTARQDLSTPINKSHMLLCSAIPGFGTIGIFMTWDTGTSTVVATNTGFTVQQLSTSYAASGPSSSRVTKVGMRIVNAGARLYQQGKVYVTHLTQRMRLPAAPSAMTSTQWNAVVGSLRSMPERYTRPYSWIDFAGGGKMEDKSLYCRVVDVPKYNDFSVHQGAVPNLDDFLDNVAVWPGSTEAPHPMSLVLVTWDNPAVADRLPDLTCSMDAQFMTRWPVDSVPGISQKDIPASDPNHVSMADKGSGEHAGGAPPK